MTTITQDHNSAFCHAASENRRQLLLQLKQLADQLENCENEVRNGQRRNENGSRSVENVDWGLNTKKEGNGKKSGELDVNKMMKKDNGHCCGSGSRGGKVSNNYYDNNYKNESNYDNFKNENIEKYGADKVYGRQYEDKGNYGPMNYKNGKAGMICVYQMVGGLETEQDKEKKKNPDKDTWCGTNRMNLGRNGVNAYQMGGGLETEQDKEKKKNPDKDTWCGTNRMNLGRNGINAYQMGGGLETEQDKEKKKNPDKDTWCGTNRMNLGRNGINAYQMGGGLETEQDKEKKKNPDKDTWCSTNSMRNENAYHNGQNKANENIEAMKPGGSRCCMQNNRDTNKFVKNVKKIDQAREKCNEYEINKLIQKSLQQMRSNPKKLGNSCDNVKPLFQNCRPGCQFTIQPQIVFPEYADKPPYRLEKPAGKCENESTLIAGTVMQGCQCTKRNGLQDQCQSHCHETPTGEKFTVDC